MAASNTPCIRVEGCLVDNDVALQAADVRRSARQGAHLKAAGEPNAIRGDVLGLATFVLVFEEELLDARDAFALGTRDHPGELGAVADRLQALFFGVADVIDVVATRGLAGRSDQSLVQHRAKGDARASAFRNGDDRRLERSDLALVQHQDAIGQRVEAVRNCADAGRQIVPFQDAQGRGQGFDDGGHQRAPAGDAIGEGCSWCVDPQESRRQKSTWSALIPWALATSCSFASCCASSAGPALLPRPGTSSG